jgi:hypothetical protein
MNHFLAVYLFLSEANRWQKGVNLLIEKYIFKAITIVELQLFL